MGIFRRAARGSAVQDRTAPDEAPTSISASERAIASGRFLEARETLRAAVDSQPTDGDPVAAAHTFRLLAEMECALANYDGAAEAAHAGLRILNAPGMPDEARLEGVRLLTALAQSHINSMHADRAEEPLQEALQLANPEEEVDGALAMRTLGEVRFQARAYGEAEATYEKALKTLFRLLPRSHPERGHVMNSWGLAAMAQGRFDEAAERLERGLRLRLEVLPEMHPDVGESLHNLAGLALKRARLDEAEERERAAGRIWEATLGTDHPRLALIHGNLGAIEQRRGRYAEAEAHYRRNLEIRQKGLAPDDPRLATSLNNLATVLQKTGHYADAEELLRRSLAIAEQAHGEDHPDVARALNNLEGVLSAQGRSEEGKACLTRAAGIWERCDGPDSAELATTLTNLARYRRTEDGDDEAEATLLHALSIKAKRLGNDHPDLATPLNNLANLYLTQGKLDQAEPLYLRSQELRAKAGQVASPETFADLAEIARRQGRFEVQRDRLLESLRLVQAALGPNAPRLAHYLRRLALAYRSLCERDLEIAQLKRAVSILERGSADLADELAGTLTILANPLTAAGRLDEAEAVYQRVLTMETDDPPLSSARLVDGLTLYGYLLLRRERYQEAESHLRRAHQVSSDIHGQGHAVTRSTLIWLGYAEAAQGRLDDAERHLLGAFGTEDDGSTLGANGATLALYGLRRVYRETERTEDLNTVLHRLVEVAAANGRRDLAIAGVLRELADAEMLEGNHQEAVSLYRRVLAADDGRFGSGFRGITAFNLAVCLASIGQDAAAYTQFSMAAGELSPARGNLPFHRALCLAVWSEFLMSRGRHGEALAFAPELEHLARLDGIPPQVAGSVFQALGMLYGGSREWERAQAALQESLIRWESAENPLAIFHAFVVRRHLAEVDLARGNIAGAERAYRELVQRIITTGTAGHPVLVSVLRQLAALLAKTGRAGEASELQSWADTIGNQYPHTH